MLRALSLTISPRWRDLPENASAAAKRAWNKKVDLVAVSEDKLERNLKRLYALVLAQSSDALLTKVMEQDGYEDIAATRDGLGLLSCIRNMMQDYEDSDYGPEQSRKAKLMLLNRVQRKNQDLKTYYNAFKTMVKVVKNVGANVGPDDTTITLMRGYVTRFEQPSQCRSRHSRQHSSECRSARRHCSRNKGGLP
jgi:hypothetical protein